MSEASKKNKSRALHILAVAGAWITLPILGLLLLFITFESSYIPQGQLASQTGIIMPILDGLLGIVLVLIIITFAWNFRKKAYFKHLLIGLWIGLGLYVMILISGLVSAINAATTTVGKNTVTCTSANQQYSGHASAVVPIATNLGTGTGFAVRDTSTILTAYHVVEGVSDIYANNSSGRVNLHVIDTAPQYDLALLKIDSPTSTFFNLSSNYKAGDEVYVYGYPSNALSAGPPSLSLGIVSRVIDLASLRLNQQDTPDGLEIVQTDAAINPGNSGGPLIGKCGVIGIVDSVSDTSKLHNYIGAVSEQNIGYAISSKTTATRFGLSISSEN